MINSQQELYPAGENSVLSAPTANGPGIKCETYDEWFETYRPKRNTLDPNASYDGCLWETFGEELQKVYAAPVGTIWTLLDGEPLVITSGYHFVNRLGYFICEVPLGDDEYMEILDD